MEQKQVREVRSHEQAALEDVFFGQSVILWARWSIILAGAELVLITAIVVFWPGSVGLKNQFFVLYYPVVFAFALVFPRMIEAAYTVLAMLAYATACFALGTVSFAHGALDLKVLLMRLIVIAAMGFLGNYYFRIQRDRLRRASQGTPSALEELKTRLQPAGRHAHS